VRGAAAALGGKIWSTREIALAQPNIDRPDIFFQMTARLVA
jgi:hypothetical protein